MGEKLTEAQWRDYFVEKPTEAGPYEWQVPSSACRGLVVRMLSHFRERGAGHSSVLSPQFDYWNGHEVTVPAGTKWRHPAPGTTLKEYRQEFLCAEGVEFDRCPFCGERPTLHGMRRHSGGVIITSNAHEYNSFWLTCCAWAKSPSMSDPRELSVARRAALAAGRQALDQNGGAPDV